MRKTGLTTKLLLYAQAGVLTALAGGYWAMPEQCEPQFRKYILGKPNYPVVEVPRETPLRITPLYNDPEVVSDAELAAVLKKVQPKFTLNKLKPNFVEHALRTWHVDATFQDPKVMSGEEMKNYLCDHGRYLAAWNDSPPLLVEKPAGMSIRWDNDDSSGSVHHDHWLASLTEAGVRLDEPVYGPRRQMTIKEVLEEAHRDLLLDERETEWSALALGLWLTPNRTWTATDGRALSFDILAQRLMRGDLRFGVCSGTHRVYSLMVLWRLDQEHDILSDEVEAAVWKHLEKVRDAISVSQFENGRWPSNWSEGKAAVEHPLEEENYRSVIATGHHLEWLAIAPKELHPPREMILRAADWLIADMRDKSVSDIQQKYTFYSHVGNALSLWRGTRPADFWREWEQQHPWEPEAEVTEREPLTAPRP